MHSQLINHTHYRRSANRQHGERACVIDDTTQGHLKKRLLPSLMQIRLPLVPKEKGVCMYDVTMRQSFY